MKTEGKTLLDRRKILLGFVGGGGLAAVGLAPLATRSLAAESKREKRKARYQETDHVKTFYRVNRYPT